VVGPVSVQRLPAALGPCPDAPSADPLNDPALAVAPVGHVGVADRAEGAGTPRTGRGSRRIYSRFSGTCPRSEQGADPVGPLSSGVTVATGAAEKSWK
jgi:hypothetical protein